MIYLNLIISDQSYAGHDKTLVPCSMGCGCPCPGVVKRKNKSEKIGESNRVCSGGVSLSRLRYVYILLHCTFR